MGIGIRRYAPQNPYSPQGAEWDRQSFELVNSSERFLEYVQAHNLPQEPLDLEAFFQTVPNISIRYESLGDAGISGSLHCAEDLDKNDNEWVITLNKDQHPRRQRFTTAHELGHYCMHRNRESHFEDVIFFRSNISNGQDWQATRFAADILMPKERVCRCFSEGMQSAEELAQHFDISVLAMRIRMEQLGLMKE